MHTLLNPSLCGMAVAGQDEEEMEVMMEALKIRLAPCGIGTDVAVQPGVIARNNMVLKEAASAFTFMEDCGVPYFERLRTLQVPQPFTCLAALLDNPNPTPSIPSHLIHVSTL